MPTNSKPGDKHLDTYKAQAIELACALTRACELLRRASGKINSERYADFQGEIAAFLAEQDVK